MNPIRIVLVEDQEQYTAQVYAHLVDVPHIEVVGVYRTGREAIEGIRALRPDVALVDLKLADNLSGVEVIRQVLAEGGTTECMVLTVFDSDTHLFQALQAGAVGYIVKGDSSLPAIVQAIVEVVDGGAPMTMGIARRILQEFKDPEHERLPLPVQGLTGREAEVLELLSTGLTTRKVADELTISHTTVRTHQKNIYRKLQVHSLVEAVMKLQQIKGR